MRRRKKRTPRKPSIDLGTPETRAKQYVPYWRSLAPELQNACMAIYDAIFLETGELIFDTSRLDHVPRSAQPEWSRAQNRLIALYRLWLDEMKKMQWDHKSIIRHCFFDEPCQDEEGFMQAMILYCELSGTLVKAA